MTPLNKWLDCRLYLKKCLPICDAFRGKQGIGVFARAKVVCSSLVAVDSEYSCYRGVLVLEDDCVGVYNCFSMYHAVETLGMYQVCINYYSHEVRCL